MVGNRLYHLRKAAGLSQLELGEIVNVSHHTISSYEKEKCEPNDATKIKMAEYFGVTVDYLVGFSDDPHPVRNYDELIWVPHGFTNSQRKMVMEFVEQVARQNK